jgi:excisionase family DNA binding protein
MHTSQHPPAARDAASVTIAALPPDHPDAPKLPTTTRRKLWSVEEGRALLGGISRASIYDLIRSGELRTVMIAGRRLIPDQAIDELISNALDREAAA